MSRKNVIWLIWKMLFIQSFLFILSGFLHFSFIKNTLQRMLDRVVNTKTRATKT